MQQCKMIVTKGFANIERFCGYKQFKYTKKKINKKIIHDKNLKKRSRDL